ncbi:uncharacterized protein [Ptychodera flava]|uniref:uncharacterized protein n=1 Tax=Ptychodera flava TaxID=63121 RepID=UPI003969F189
MPSEQLDRCSCSGDLFLCLYSHGKITNHDTLLLQALLVQVGCHSLVNKIDKSSNAVKEVGVRLYTCTPRITSRHIKECIEDLYKSRGLDKCDRSATLFCNRLLQRNQKVWCDAKITVYGHRITVTFISGSGTKEFEIALNDEDKPICTMTNFDDDEVPDEIFHRCKCLTKRDVDEILDTYSHRMCISR